MTERLYGRAFVRGAIQPDTLITMGDGVFADIVQTKDAPPEAQRFEGIAVPGFVDMHIHGGAGSDFMDGDSDANARILRFHAQNGTTSLAATTLSGSTHHLQSAVEAIAVTAQRKPAGAEICGIHLEGPYINPKRAGAQDATSIRPADIHEIESLLAKAPRLRWIMTLAPEIDGARVLVEHFRERILFSIGHTAADYAETVAALEWGASHFTHLFNAMTGMHHREPGVVGAALVSTNATAEMIADGVHVHPAVMRITVAAMRGRLALVTDAIRACGMPEGRYKLYEHDVAVSAGMARLSDGTLAGSVLTMAGAVRNMVELAGLPIESVIPLAAEIPARILGISARKGRLEPGLDADLAILTSKLEIESVYARGVEVVGA